MFLKAGIATMGRCEALMKSTHVKRTRYAHEVSLVSLFLLRNEAYSVDNATLLSHLKHRCHVDAKNPLSFLLENYNGIGRPASEFCSQYPRIQFQFAYTNAARTTSLVFCTGPHSLFTLGTCFQDT